MIVDQEPTRYQDAVEVFATRGFLVSDDKFNRLKPFGIQTVRISGSLDHFVTPATMIRLQHILEVSRKMHCDRDFGRLAFELAMRGDKLYPERLVLRYVRKRLRTFFAFIRFVVSRSGTGTASVTFISENRARVTSELFAKRLVKSEDLASSVMRVALAQIFYILLVSLFRKQNLEPRPFRQLLYITGLKAADADRLASQLCNLWNGTRGILVASDNASNELFRLLERVIPDVEIRSAIEDSRLFLPLMDPLKRMLPGFTQPDPQLQYDVRQDSHHLFAVIVVAQIIAYYDLKSTRILRDQIRAGDTDVIIKALKELEMIVSQIKLILRAKAENDK